MGMGFWSGFPVFVQQWMGFEAEPLNDHLMSYWKKFEAEASVHGILNFSRFDLVGEAV